MAVFTIRAKSDRNSDIKKGFTCQVNSKWSGAPDGNEIADAIKALGLKSDFCGHGYISAWEIIK